MDSRANALPPARRSPRRSLLAVAVLCAHIVAGGCSQGNKGALPDGAASDIARLERSNALLERRVELAAGRDFYLLLDPAAADLTLMLRGAELRRFPVLGLQVGYPRVSWFDRRQSRAWQGLIWSNGELVPARPIDRIVITGEERAKGEEEPPPPPIPPTAEELYPVPPTYLVRFAGGLSIEIRPREADAKAGRLARFRTWWTAKWANVASVISASNRDIVRLRIVLDSKDADSLFRSLPPSVRLLVLAGEPARR